MFVNLSMTDIVMLTIGLLNLKKKRETITYLNVQSLNYLTNTCYISGIVPLHARPHGNTGHTLVRYRAIPGRVTVESSHTADGRGICGVASILP